VQAIKQEAENIKQAERKLTEQENTAGIAPRPITKFRFSDKIDKLDLSAFAKEQENSQAPSQQTQLLQQDNIEDVRTEVISNSTNPTVPSTENKAPSTIQQRDQTSWLVVKEVAKVVMELATRLETEEQQVKIKQEFDRLLFNNSNHSFGDLESLMESLFKNVIGTDSKTARVLKAIHQNIILTGVFQLKSKVTMNTMTRDVRTRDGWRINVFMGNNVVVVSHKRREQSLATAPKDEQYWFEWELRMTFDRELSSMESSVLKITDLEFDAEIKPHKKVQISRAFSSGNLIVS